MINRRWRIAFAAAWAMSLAARAHSLDLQAYAQLFVQIPGTLQDAHQTLLLLPPHSCTADGQGELAHLRKDCQTLRQNIAQLENQIYQLALYPDAREEYLRASSEALLAAVQELHLVYEKNILTSREGAGVAGQTIEQMLGWDRDKGLPANWQESLERSGALLALALANSGISSGSNLPAAQQQALIASIERVCPRHTLLFDRPRTLAHRMLGSVYQTLRETSPIFTVHSSAIWDD